MSLEFKVVKLNSKKHEAVCNKINSLKIASLSSDISITKYKKSIDIDYLFDFDDYDNNRGIIDNIVEQLLEIFTALSEELNVSIKYSLQREEYEDLIICSFINGVEYDGTPEDIVRFQKENEKFRKSNFSPFMIESKEGGQSIKEMFDVFNNGKSIEKIIHLLEHLESDDNYEFFDNYSYSLNDCGIKYNCQTTIEISVRANLEERGFYFEISTDLITVEEKSKSLALINQLTDSKNSRTLLLDGYWIKFYKCTYSQFHICVSKFLSELFYDMTLKEFGNFLINIKTGGSYDQDTIEILELKIKSYVKKDNELWEYRLGLFYMQLSSMYKFPKRSAFNLFDKLSERGNLTAQLICANTCYSAKLKFPELYKETEHYLTLASNQGDESAKRNLARFKKYRELTDILTKPLW